MKIVVNIFNEEGDVVIGQAIESDCRTLVINGIPVIQEGGVHAEMRPLLNDNAQADNVVPLQIEPFEPIN
tara:strand:+ start:232 stop:441 length:210 start_codon:yes stop_codon:yes gene_type:complete